MKLFAPPQGDARSLDDPTRKWIKAFRFPEWFVCQNERCWEDADQPPRRDAARPRRLLRINQLDGQGHKCKGGKGKASKVQPIRFIRACRKGHIDDIAWFSLVHRKHPDCKRPILWLDEAGATGDLQDVRITCSGCGDNLRMSAAAQRFTEGQADARASARASARGSATVAPRAAGRREPMRFLLRSATHAYFSVTASVIHVPDAGAELREARRQGDRSDQERQERGRDRDAPRHAGPGEGRARRRLERRGLRRGGAAARGQARCRTRR